MLSRDSLACDHWAPWGHPGENGDKEEGCSLGPLGQDQTSLSGKT